MSDKTKLQVLQLIRHSYEDRGMPNIHGALDWAIDQLRWRRVEDELPPTTEGLKYVFYGKNANPEWNIATGTGVPISPNAVDVLIEKGYTHWRPITLPEGE